MSSDFYFRKWKTTLSRIEEIVQLDLDYQNNKAHDNKRCEAVTRLNGVLGQYIVTYNETVDCLQQNLQMQKTKYMTEMVKAITNRIIELKHQITKLEFSNIQFLGHGLTRHKITTYDTEFLDIPSHFKRLQDTTILLSEALQKAEQRKENLLRIAEKEAKANAGNIEVIKHWWDEDEDDESDEQTTETEQEESEETVQKRKMAALIQAHERSRKITQWFLHRKQKRLIWEKELAGTLQPKAPLELRVKSAKLIQKVVRAYFQIKRRNNRQCQENEILGIKLCSKPNNNVTIMSKQVTIMSKQMNLHRLEQRKKLKQEWITSCENLKTKYTIKAEELGEEYRDFIRSWFRKWFDDIQYFHDIPKENEGGCASIIKEELPEPLDWWEEYKQYLTEQKLNKNKSSYQRKWTELEAEKEKNIRNKETHIKKKLEADLMKKLMKNPKFHPGFRYPKSKKMQHILDILENYKCDWKDLDHNEERGVKEKYVTDVDVHNIYATIKMEVLKTVDKDMKLEFKILKKALKMDYSKNGEKMPEPMKKKKQRAKKKNKAKNIVIEDVYNQLEDLAFKNILKQYPKKKLENFTGEYNYAGDDLRCNYIKTHYLNGELRSVWWEICRKLTHGFHRVLIVGPRQSGKTLLVHILASLNDAALFELNLDEINEQVSSATDLLQIMMSIVACARASQPSVIYIRHVHRLYYNKFPLSETITNVDDMKRFLVRKLCKKILKTDKITVIASCVDPWLTKSRKLLKQFPVVVLVPDTSYSTVVQLLTHWVNENHPVPRNFDVHSLARMLRGYSLGYLKRALSDFLSPNRIVKIAAHGLSSQEVYNFILNNENGSKIEYKKYLKWYYNNTHWGKKETKHIEEQLEFKQALEKFAKKSKKKKQASAVSSAITIH